MRKPSVPDRLGAWILLTSSWVGRSIRGWEDDDAVRPSNLTKYFTNSIKHWDSAKKVLGWSKSLATLTKQHNKHNCNKETKQKRQLRLFFLHSAWNSLPEFRRREENTKQLSSPIGVGLRTLHLGDTAKAL